MNDDAVLIMADPFTRS